MWLSDSLAGLSYWKVCLVITKPVPECALVSRGAGGLVIGETLVGGGMGRGWGRGGKKKPGLVIGEPLSLGGVPH